MQSQENKEKENWEKSLIALEIIAEKLNYPLQKDIGMENKGEIITNE